MLLHEQLQTRQEARHNDQPEPAVLPAADPEIKARLHRRIREHVDLASLEALSPERLKAEIAALVERIIADESLVITENEHHLLIREIQDELLGLGPLELLLADPSISDILVNGYRQVFIERQGRLERSEISFSDDQHLLRIIERIVSGVGRQIDESSPMVDARLPDGSRINAIVPPVAVDGPMLAIRRVAAAPLQMKEMVERYRSLTPEMAILLEALVRAKVNILISGPTGSGKTALLNVLAGYIPPSERIVTIEEATELQLRQPHLVRLESRPPDLAGQGEISQRALLRNGLRMRPDRVIVGEIRGAEAVDLLQAMNTGHEGSLSTLHANTPRDALARLENMVGIAGFSLSPYATRQQIASAVTVIVQLARLIDGQRKVVSLQESCGMDGGMVGLREIFTYRQTDIATDGTVNGYTCATGLRPKFLEHLAAFGMNLPDSLFDPARRYG